MTRKLPPKHLFKRGKRKNLVKSGVPWRANLRERARRPFVDDAIENLSATRALIAA
jgi:hypothetical protein